MHRNDIKLCAHKQCTGCYACAESCPKSAIQLVDSHYCWSPVIDPELCIGCGRCMRVCPELVPTSRVEPQAWYQGWAADSEERASSASGGVAAAVVRSFLARDGVAFACSFEKGEFRFLELTSCDDVERIKGSMYVKSNPAGVYISISQRLKEGREVLFIGLPCQVAALRSLVGEAPVGLYTIDLICHGTPPRSSLEKFLNQYDVELSSLHSIRFRQKECFQLDAGLRAIDVPGVVDRYLLAFLNGLTYSEGCYQCRYASLERVSDLTLGDSWGSNLKDETSAGISLILCQTKKGVDLLADARLDLHEVDVDCAIEHNAQLQAPSVAPLARRAFLKRDADGISFNYNVALSLPVDCIKQLVKGILIRLHLYGGYT